MIAPSTRRRFLQQAALASAAVAAAPWTSTAAPAVRPAQIIDTHTHFYDPTRPGGVPWPPKDDQVLYRTVLPQHYRALSVPQKVNSTVVVEASPLVEDNQWILDLAAKDPFITGFVGNLPVGTPDFAKLLDRFAANPLFRGLRLGGQRLKDGLQQPAFMADLKRLADRDLALDTLGDTTSLDDVDALAQKLPNLRIIIDHVANLQIDGKTPPDDWRRGMERAGRHTTVYCKVSGLVEGTGKRNQDAPADVTFYRPMLDHVWGVFGEDRMVYGSNWPVSERFAPLGTVEKIMHDYVAGKGQQAADKIFAANATAFYKPVKR